MIFKKPVDVKYTDMCIFIDKKVEDGKITDDEATQIYEYLYLLIYMLAVKQRFFHKEEYYDEFAIITAGDVFHRLFTHPKLHEYNEDGTPKLAKIKSCLNYIKTILHGRKVTFEQDNYSQKFIDLQQVDSDFRPVASTYSVIRDNTDFTLDLNLDIYLESITDTLRSYLNKNSPYRKNKQLMKSIYLSCLLSVLNLLSFTCEDIQNIQTKYSTQEAKTRYLDKIYSRNRQNCITLYHLPYQYKSYITVLVRQIFTLIKKDIHELCSSKFSIPDDVLMSISLSEVLGKDYHDN